MAYTNQLEAALAKTLKMEPFQTDGRRPPRFRLSSSPFCAYRFLYQWYDFVKTEADFWDYTSDFYTGVGTSIHSSLQKWLPINNPGLYLGNWECPVCKKVISSAVGPKFCKKCGKWMTYEEFSFYEKPGFTGHCDGILITDTSLVKTLGVSLRRTKPMDEYIRTCKTPVEAVVLEFKSTGSYRAKKLTGPTPNNKAQALMYVPCANRKMQELGLNVKIIGAVIKYLSRDNPNSASNDFYFKDTGTGLFKYNRDIVRSIYSSIKEKSVTPIKDMGLPCKSKYKDLYCDCGYMEACGDLRKELKMFLEDTRKEIKKDLIFLRNLEVR